MNYQVISLAKRSLLYERLRNSTKQSCNGKCDHLKLSCKGKCDRTFNNRIIWCDRIDLWLMIFYNHQYWTVHFWSVRERLSALRPDSSQSQSCNCAPFSLPGAPATSIHFPESLFLINPLLVNVHL